MYVESNITHVGPAKWSSKITLQLLHCVM